MKVSLSPLALQQARSVQQWWKQHRPGAEVRFEQELDRLLDRLAAISPRSPLGIVDSEQRGKQIWRVLLRRSNQHVYYSLDEVHGTVVVRSIWGATRGRGPKL